MLGDSERATLDQIAFRLLAEDPRFVRSFVARAQRLSGAPRTLMNRHLILVRLTGVSAALSVLLLVAGAVGLSLIFVTVTVMLALALGCRENEPRPPSI